MVAEVVKFGIEWELSPDDSASGTVRDTVPDAHVLSDEDVGTVGDKKNNERAFQLGIWKGVEVHAFAVAKVGAA